MDCTQTLHFFLSSFLQRCHVVMKKPGGYLQDSLTYFIVVLFYEAIHQTKMPLHTLEFCSNTLKAGGTHLEFTWHNEFRSIDSNEHIDSTEDEDGQDDGKVTDEFSHLGESKHKDFL